MPSSAVTPRPFRVLSDEERSASLRQALLGRDTGQDLWVFGYGSLIWRPEFDFTEQRMALLRGYHRSLCLWSRINRGTPEQPGLVFGLDAGGSCKGVVYRIPASRIADTMDALWRREMPSGAYTPKWLETRTDDGPVAALAFVMNRHTDAYVRDLPQERLIDIVRTAHGTYGPCLEYVVETSRALRRSGIQDARLEALMRQLQTESALNG
ncbi:gamma-glutamylcyclotransferase [Paracandidimonas soli]|uniref:gamma-glutamylcyclotransferase n=1 Tax=Paracandidimonas soli TaxID=1917182 RepID=UPI00333FB1E9